MDFSIIIPTANRPDFLGKCLEAILKAIDKYAANYEIIVSDDSILESTNKVVKASFPHVQWLVGPRKGPSSNRNHAAKKARGAWLLFIDDDCIPSPDWFKAYQLAIEQYKEILIFEGKTLAIGERERFDQIAPVNENGGNLWSCNFLIQNDLFKALNGFDESFLYPAMEDVDFFMRIKLREKILFVPDAIVFHPWRVVKPFSMFRKHLKSHLILAKKHGYYSKISYRWSRIKIFLGHIKSDLLILNKFSFKGTILYFENLCLNFILIFA